MATGDITHDSVRRCAGDHWILTGTIEADATARAFAVTDTKSAILYCNLACTTDDATNDARIALNKDSDFSSDVNGTIAVQVEGTDTYRFTAGVV